MKESIINYIRGDKLESDVCQFCGSSKNCKIFGMISRDNFDGKVLMHFSVCEEHLSKLNALLSGEFDIDRINLEKYRKHYGVKGIRLR